MTSDRHLALVALMTELEGPTNSYRHAVRQAARQITDSPDFNATVARGNRALDDIEQAVRHWVAKHPEAALAAQEVGSVVIAASEIELEGGDVMLQEMSVGDPIEIEKQTGPMSPGTWVITAFETEDRSRARVRRLTRAEIEAARHAEATARIYE